MYVSVLPHPGGSALAILLAIVCAGACSTSSEVPPAKPTPPFSNPNGPTGPADGGREDSGGAVALPDAEAPGGPDGGVSEGGAARPALRFLVVGDTGKGGPSARSVGAAMAQKCQAAGCDFALLLGDNIYESGVTSSTDPQFESKFEIPFGPVQVPFYAILGNHDYGGNGLGNEFDKSRFQIEYSQHSKKWRMPAEYYHFVAGNAEFFALDTNQAMYQRDAVQRQEVKAWVASSTATWKIAFGHHPYKSNGPHGNAGSYDGVPVSRFNGQGIKTLVEDAICGKADIYFSAHDHSRQWLTETCNGTALLLSGTGATGTALGGTNPIYYQSNELGFAYVVIEGNKLTAEFVDTSGAINYTRSVVKK